VIKLWAAVLLGLQLVIASVPATAHHSAAQFDFRAPKTLSGVVKEVKVSNPHMHLVLEISDAKGKRDVTYEGHSMNNIYRRGWRKDMVKVGDTITITIAPRKDGADGGYVTAVKTADGNEF
jgi:hypothetical protein